MALATVTINAIFLRQNGVPEAGARVELALDRHGLDGGFVLPILVSGVTDSEGKVTLEAWPNGRGQQSSSYQVRVYRDTNLIFSGTAVFPDAPGPLDLRDYIVGM